MGCRATMEETTGPFVGEGTAAAFVGEGTTATLAAEGVVSFVEMGAFAFVDTGCRRSIGTTFVGEGSGRSVERGQGSSL